MTTDHQQSAKEYAHARVTELLGTNPGHEPHTRWLATLDEREYLAALLADAYHAGEKAATPADAE